ncbi:putative B3 domain-containing protein At5g66980 isoform X2 [Malania oleifera]|uniref:putative B3 domain-containing protein At5g66980 isoform X2 n=1 Tax=Malania oleifera TaxID=397392 RepID=UPI0025ADB55D|nr:putative B3 domain-containing protein At5g66980 isoform X2 [Malania oleifera]
MASRGGGGGSGGGRGRCSVMKKPEFFKVFLAHLSSERLRIPPAFIEHFNGNVPKEVVLKDLAGVCCSVEVETFENGVFIGNGWQGFLNDHSIEHGDFLVFRYNGKYLFYVSVFAKNGCKKLKTAVTDLIKNEQGAEEAEPTGIKPAHVHKLKFSELDQMIEISGRWKLKSIATRNAEVRSVFEAAGLDSPKYPCFIASMSMPYALNIPKLLLSVNDIKLKEEVVLCNQNGRLWPVKITFRKDGRIAITTGWIKFSRDNKLKKKDKCVIEFIIGRGRICQKLKAYIFYSEASRKRRRCKAVRKP